MTETNDPPMLPILWDRVPTVFVDGVLGSARASGIHRVMLGEIVLNPDGDSTTPATRPVVNLALTYEAMDNLIRAFQEMQEWMRPTEPNNAD